MLLAKKVTGAFPDMSALRKLYISAFPAKERDPLTELLPVHHDGHDLLAFYHEEEFCGFASLLTYKTITHILYIAICDRFRDHHYGSEAMRILCSPSAPLLWALPQPPRAATNIPASKMPAIPLFPFIFLISLLFFMVFTSGSSPFSRFYTKGLRQSGSFCS